MQTRFTTEQLADRDIAASEPILRKCVHCGFCTATCPTYVLLGDELDGPRGRIYLIKDMLENSRPATSAVVQHIDRCLSCLACMTTCPSGVHYQHLIDHARNYIERTYRRPWQERALRTLLAWILPYPRRLRTALAAASVLRGLARPMPAFAARLGERMPAPWRAMARLAGYEAPVREVARRRAAGTAPSRGRVALLAGCAQSVLTPGTEAACARLIERAGFEVVVIEGCCGALVHHLGRESATRSFAAALLERIEAERRRGLAAVIVDASGCGTHLKDFGHLFRDDPALAGPASELAALTRDITEWLAELDAVQTPRADSRGPTPSRKVTVAYHSACSMQHGQRLDPIPRRLLERAGFEVREIPEGHLCCGSAGTYNILQPKIATELRERKLANIRATGAHVVATGNVGCMVQLAGAGISVVHTAELLDWAAGGPAPLDPAGV